MALRKAKRRKEFLLILIPAFLAVVDGAANTFGVDMKLIWIPSAVLLVWPIYLLTERFPEEDPRFSFLQSVRVTVYFTGLIVFIALGGVIVWLDPPMIFIPPLVIVVGALVTKFFDRMYRNATRLLALDNFQQFRLIRMIVYAGAATAWLAGSVVMADLLVWKAWPISSILLGILVALGIGYVAYYYEGESARCAEQLADRLKDLGKSSGAAV